MKGDSMFCFIVVVFFSIQKIMLALLSAVPSLFTSMETVIPSRSEILRAILRHQTNTQYNNKRSEETEEAPSLVECCPSETRFIQINGGISRDGKVVELFRNQRTVQKFYETTCKPEIKDRPCRLIARKNKQNSRCVQKYSYVYAIFKDYNVSQSYRFDYIRMKTGCACEAIQF